MTHRMTDGHGEAGEHAPAATRLHADPDPRAPFPGDSEMARRCRVLDWDATPLGPAERWPSSLRTAVALVLGSGFPTILVWGPQLVQIYNDAYVPLIGAKHPAALGRPTHESWPELRAQQAPIFARVFAGETVTLRDAHYRLDRSGTLEDAYFDATFVPVPLETGEIGGSMSTLFETTTQVAGRALAAALDASEARYRTLFESIDQGFCVIEVLFERDDGTGEGAGPGKAVDYRFLEANPAFVAQTGLVDAVGQRMRELAPAHEAHWFEIYGRVALTGEPTRFEAPAEALGRWYDVYAFRIGAPEQRRVAVLFDNITARKQAETERERLLTALGVERARLEQVFRLSPGFAVAYRGPTHVYEFVNDAYYALVGRRPVLGRPLDEAIPEAREQGFTGLLDRVLETGEPWVGRETPVWLERTPGAPRELRYADMVFQPLVEADGTRSGVLAHGTDITEQVLARREVERLLAESERARADAEAARSEAEAASRAKGEFLAVMSHELRTPLNAIAGYAELLELGIRGPVTEAQRADLARIQQSQRHLLGLINQVLNYTRVDAGAVRYDLTDVPVAEALAAAEALVLPQARARGLTLLRGDCPPELAVRADRDKLQQILLNLLTNAVKFTDAPGEVRVTCATEPVATERVERVTISVADTGIGIAADKLAGVFEPFVQVDQRLTRPHEGVGLGLAISRDLARGMGGDLSVESTPGVGSTFTLALPRA
ncbi:MAG TPA: ATP-binding protein [Gemmatimonadaceae bacterium]|nr:ATP-binding protein [Gemmatimonadaceae bacterium]